MVSVIRPRIVVAFILVLASCLALGLEPSAQAAGRRRQQVYVPGAYYYPTAAAAPVAAAPVFAGAISTASAPTYYAPGTVSYAPSPLMVTTGSVATAGAPTMMTATTASAPVAAAPAVGNAPSAGTVYYYNAPTTPGTAAAPVGNAPNAGLNQDQINSIVEELRDLRESLKDEGTTGSDRKNQLIEKARELVADEKGISVDELKASDRMLARRLVELAGGGANSGNSGLGPYPNQYPGACPSPYGMAPQFAPPVQSFYLYPVALYPYMPGKHCGHHHFCHCGKYP
jgi:hypothetical protein